MGYTSDVTIMLQPKAYKMVMDSINEYNKKQTNGYRFVPYEDLSNPDGEHIIKWSGVKWYAGFEDVQSVTHVLRELCNEHEEEDGYGYKCIQVGEDGAIEEESNNWDWGSDMYPLTTIEYPSDFK